MPPTPSDIFTNRSNPLVDGGNAWSAITALDQVTLGVRPGEFLVDRRRGSDQGQRGSHASGRAVSLRTCAGSRPLTISARLTSSTTRRTAARTATHRPGRFSAAPS